MKVRKATRKELPLLVELSEQLNLDHAKRFSRFPKLAKDSRKVKTKYFKSLFGKNNSVFFVAEEKGKVLGFILGKEEKLPPVFKETRVGHVGDFYVRPGFRSKGVGKKLFAELKKWFREKKFRDIQISFYSQNKKAKKLYLEMGFKPEKEFLTMKV